MNDQLASDLVRIPLTFRERGNISVVSLLIEIADQEPISVAPLWKALKASPDLVDEWVSYSEDKRTSEGWFLIDRGSYWEVGYLAPRGKGAKSLRFQDRMEACATFASNELEGIRSRAGRSSSAGRTPPA